MQQVTQAKAWQDPTFSVSALGRMHKPERDSKWPFLVCRKCFLGLVRLEPKATATLIAEAKYQEYLDAQNQLRYEVAAAYYPLYELEELID